MDQVEIPYLSATELARLTRRKEVSPVETTRAYLDRIERLDSQLNSYIEVAIDDAMNSARRLEKQILAGGDTGLLCGVPVALKDICHVEGWRTTGGSRILRDNVVDYDSTVAARLRGADAVLLGKLNTTEFASGETFDFPYGTPRNPWDLSRSPGASSGGSGAATSAFLCGASLGGDTGGSIRNPSAYSGIVGLRPTWGRVSRYGTLGACWSMDTIGPMTRTVEDCALVLQAIAGRDPHDAYTAKGLVPDYRQSLDGDIRGLKVALLSELVDPEVIEPEIEEGVRLVAKELEKLGATVDEVSIPLLRNSPVIAQTISGAEGAFMQRENLKNRLKEMDFLARVRSLACTLVPAQAYHKALRLREAVRSTVLETLETFDVLICPSAPTRAVKIPATPNIIQSKDEVLTKIWGRSRVNAPFNLAGVPALSVPCGFTSDGLPMGLQIVGRPLNEETVFKVAHAYEQATPWHTRRPPLA